VDPQLRSFLVNWLSPLGVEPKTIAQALGRIDLQPQPTPASGESAMDAILFQPKTSIRRALILALGRYGQDELSSADRKMLIDKLIGLYRDDPDAGIHGASESTLRQWSLQTKLKEIDATLRGQARGNRHWYVNSRGQTFAIVYGPVEFGMGSHPNEPDRFSNETPHRRLIPRCFAIATKEVTVEQYQEFTREHPRFGPPESELNKYSPAPDGPMIGVSWYGAAAYCNWLSKQEGLPEDQWCYEPNEQGEYAEGMRIKAEALKLKGYRLPTGAEWEYSCRAGAGTSRYYGSSSELLPKYAWYLANSPARARPCGSLLPNDLGLFDMLGNMYEWCQDREVAYQPGTFIDVMTKSERVNEDPRLLRGGAFTLLAAYVRSAFRFWSTPTNRYLFCSGLRPVRTCP
jgi:formylglycine-generating enzyme required for sulfatase activity